MREEKGITLVALIITIIVMLILVGVSVMFALGEGGIITRAKTAGNSWESIDTSVSNDANQAVSNLVSR